MGTNNDLFFKENCEKIKDLIYEVLDEIQRLQGHNHPNPYVVTPLDTSRSHKEAKQTNRAQNKRNTPYNKRTLKTTLLYLNDSN